MKYKLKFVFFSFLFFIGLNNLSAQYSPYFENYSLEKYEAGNQNWDVSRAKNGRLYVANNNGLLEFDGKKWDLIELPNKTTIRSVLAHANLIYTGSYEEFGYWNKNNKGDLSYTSLSDQIRNKISADEEIWQILSYKKSIIFRSFSNIYIYAEGGEIKKIKTQSTAISCNVVGDDLYVSTLKNGIYSLNNGELIPDIVLGALKDVKVLNIVEHAGKLMLITSLKGCFYYEHGRLIPTHFEINELIQAHLLNGFSLLDDGRMVFGTIKDGIYLTDKNGALIFHINKGNGLANNTILSQYLDEDNKLWLGLDNGLASVNLNSHNYFFNDVSGKLGSVYDVISYNGTTYIGSNTGLFYLDNEGELVFMKGSQGQVWDLRVINGDLICGHNEGTFLIRNNNLELISSYTGGWILQKIPEQQDTYIQGTYTGLVRFKKIDNSWRVKNLGETTMPFRFLVFEEDNIAWAAHAYKGVYRIKFDKNYDTITNIVDYNKKGITSDYNIRVYKIKNEICFKTNNGWLKYEPLLDSIVPYDFLNTKFGRDSYIISKKNLDFIALKRNNEVIEFETFAEDEEIIALPSMAFKNRLIVGSERVSKLNDSIYALNLDNGFMLINRNHMLDKKNRLFTPQIDKIKIDTISVSYEKGDIIEFEYSEKIKIAVSSPKSENYFFQYSLYNTTPVQWTNLENEQLELSNLSSGSYTISFRTSNNLGEISSSEQLEINIRPPWYSAKLGFFIYALIVLFLILLFYFLHKRKINKEQNLLKLQFVNEQKELLREKTVENEKRIVQLKNESLKNELKLKSKQLANTAMALVKKNEALLGIKSEMISNKSKFDHNFSLNRILKKIDYSIGHEDEWEIFEYNFNQVHEEFFKELKIQFPKLTHKDLKICAFIKMNLSNKEIAPLMNISIRGVETHRYRLKRKLNLKKEESISAYLINYS